MKNKQQHYSFEDKLDHPLNSNYLTLKRYLDVIAASGLFAATSPIILLFALLVRLETPGSPVYRQERVGLMGQRFMISKLRSMYNDAESKSGAIWAKKHDARVTKIGKFMRKTRIDELPQLLNVIKGEMSMIGPRPERPNLTEQFSKDVPGFEQRLVVKPGLSGYAQVHGGYDVTPAQKYAMDKHYIEHFGFWEDFKIVFETLRVVITGDGAR